jgi:hypothetical protein
MIEVPLYFFFSFFLLFLLPVLFIETKELRLPPLYPPSHAYLSCITQLILMEILRFFSFVTRILAGNFTNRDAKNACNKVAVKMGKKYTWRRDGEVPNL